MGMNLGFLKYPRRTSLSEDPLERIKHYHEFHLYLSNEEQSEQAARCMDCGVPYCQYGEPIAGKTVGCPLGNPVPEFNDLLWQGRYEAAYRRLSTTNNFPEFTSRVCPALCEKACTCSANGEAVTTHENEFAIIETAFDAGYVKPARDIPRTGKKTAVIGSGPAGLAAAAQLNFRGHTVDVYERSDRPGGLLMYGIPGMKLDKNVVLRRIALMEEEGIRFLTDRHINTKKKAEDLLAKYDAVLLCCGASRPRDVKVEGRDAEGICFAVDFLTSTTRSLLDHDMKEGTYISAKDKDVVIVGSGDTANDCLAVAVRHGAKSVLQMQRSPRPPVCRRDSNPWPEYPDVYAPGYGQEEAMAYYGKDPSIYGATVSRFLKDEDGRLNAVEIVDVKKSVDPESGRAVSKTVKGSERVVPAQLAIIAAGFEGAEPEVLKAFGASVSKRGLAETGTGAGRDWARAAASDPEKSGSSAVVSRFATARPGVFAAGDMRRGASLVVWAIREGRDAAREVDAYLNGYTNL